MKSRKFSSTMNFYFDTCIWRDYIEERLNLSGKSLGAPVEQLITYIQKNKHTIIISDVVENELTPVYSTFPLLFTLLQSSGILKKISFTREQLRESKCIASEREIPTHDVLHSVLSREAKAILITRDKHFNKLRDIVIVRRPEEIF